MQDGSRGGWCLVEGETNVAQGRSGILFLSHPAKPDASGTDARLAADANGVGEIFFLSLPLSGMRIGSCTV